MDRLFLTVLNMSITGAFVIAAVCAARLLLKRAPKIISYCLWAVAWFRLVCPFPLEGAFSLIPFTPEFVQSSLIGENVSFISALEAAYKAVGDTVNGGGGTVTVQLEKAPQGGQTVTTQAYHSEAWVALGAYIWPVGAAAFFIYGVASYILLKRKMRGAVYTVDNIYESANIKSPFVLGIFKPKIYLPAGSPENERGYVILHEQTHIKRRDHLVKFAAYFALCLHWFNPFVWAAFLLTGADMEMACDERVLRETGGGTKKDYSLSLLTLAAERRVIAGSPLAFGESGVKRRIKNILKFKQPPRAMIVAASALAVVLSAGFAVNRTGNPGNPPNIAVLSSAGSIEWNVGKNKWNGGVYDRPDNLQLLMADKTIEDLAYIQNGEQIAVRFYGRNPDSITLTEYILQKNGEEKYSITNMEYDIRFNALDNRFNAYDLRSYVFSVKQNAATMLSSNSADYMRGNTIKGYRLVCRWGANECEYAFVIRGDAAMLWEINADSPEYQDGADGLIPFYIEQPGTRRDLDGD